MQLDRRAFSAGLVALLASAHRSAHPATSPRIGVLDDEPKSIAIDAFREALRELGYIEGQTVGIEYKSMNGQEAAAPKLAAELVAAKVDAILAPTTAAALAAKNATRTIPIVFAVVADPVGTKLVTELAKPGGNVTGLTTAKLEGAPKRLELLKELAGGASRCGLLFDPADASNVRLAAALVEPAHRLRMSLQTFPVSAPADFAAAFAAITAARIDALLVAASPLTLANAQALTEHVARARVPAMYGSAAFAEAGGLMSYAADLAENYRRAGEYVAKILKGTAPGALPVEQVSKPELVINLGTARSLRLTPSRWMLLQATRVIE
jgi:putative ABC transport system substrate-binding protein